MITLRDDPEPDEGPRFFCALLIAVPLALLLWGAGWWLVTWIMGFVR